MGLGQQVKDKLDRKKEEKQAQEEKDRVRPSSTGSSSTSSATARAYGGTIDRSRTKSTLQTKRRGRRIPSKQQGMLKNMRTMGCKCPFCFLDQRSYRGQS